MLQRQSGLDRNRVPKRVPGQRDAHEQPVLVGVFMRSVHGAGDGIRTRSPLLGKQMTPTPQPAHHDAGFRIRTRPAICRYSTISAYLCQFTLLLRAPHHAQLRVASDTFCRTPDRWCTGIYTPALSRWCFHQLHKAGLPPVPRARRCHCRAGHDIYFHTSDVQIVLPASASSHSSVLLWHL